MICQLRSYDISLPLLNLIAEFWASRKQSAKVKSSYSSYSSLMFDKICFANSTKNKNIDHGSEP